ncbi:hypothetical protein N1851_019264 [Merluccius polli]|uniref:Uncharacterized protein n=1 Tax=Merluccius polli TaxID=89951 RepID=A0AA47NXT0_MERPO|nr:hypothetical protein N1851_019264 [Merluccius polli]
MTTEKKRSTYFNALELEVLMLAYGEYEHIFRRDATPPQQRRKERRHGRKLLPESTCNSTGEKWTWKQLKMKHKNIIQNERRQRPKKRVEGHLHHPLTEAEELALSQLLKRVAQRLKASPGEAHLSLSPPRTQVPRGGLGQKIGPGILDQTGPPNSKTHTFLFFSCSPAPPAGEARPPAPRESAARPPVPRESAARPPVPRESAARPPVPTGVGNAAAGPTGVGGAAAGPTGVGNAAAGPTGVGGAAAGPTGVGGTAAGPTGVGNAAAGPKGVGGAAGDVVGGAAGGPVPRSAGGREADAASPAAAGRLVSSLSGQDRMRCPSIPHLKHLMFPDVTCTV